MRNILLRLAFIGTAYHGWQVQQNAVSVMHVVQDALEKAVGKREDLTGCSRTDAGVHANGYCANFFTENTTELFKIKRGLNALLPQDIGVLSCEEVQENFHARYSAVGKRYVYILHNSDGKNPFWQGRALAYWPPVDLEKLQGVCALFLGQHDFKGFCSKKTDQQNTVRTIHRCEVSRQGDFVYFTVEGDGFLYNMVRMMVGALLRVNEGRIDKEQILAALTKQNPPFTAFTAPAHGLYLDKVFYEKPANWKE